MLKLSAPSYFAHYYYGYLLMCSDRKSTDAIQSLRRGVEIAVN